MSYKDAGNRFAFGDQGLCPWTPPEGPSAPLDSLTKGVFDPSGLPFRGEHAWAERRATGAPHRRVGLRLTVAVGGDCAFIVEVLLYRGAPLWGMSISLADVTIGAHEVMLFETSMKRGIMDLLTEGEDSPVVRQPTPATNAKTLFSVVWMSIRPLLTCFLFSYYSWLLWLSIENRKPGKPCIVWPSRVHYVVFSGNQPSNHPAIFSATIRRFQAVHSSGIPSATAISFGIGRKVTWLSVTWLPGSCLCSATSAGRAHPLL